jgi:hypothetical protein
MPWPNLFKPRKKPQRFAIAIMAYNNLDYFSQVLASVVAQDIDGDDFTSRFDLFIFQDALQARHQDSNEDFEAIKTLSLKHVTQDRFIRQTSNIGTGLHFEFIEENLFEAHGYEFCIFLEHDFVLGTNYLQAMLALHERFKNDERIAAVSGHSSAYRESLEKQSENLNSYRVMSHDWGAGVFKRTWQKRLPAMRSYYELLRGMPFEQRNNLLIQDWMAFMGFVRGSTSQDTIKACVDSGLGLLRLTTYVNLGTYIGQDGMHWNEQIYKSAGYHDTVLFKDNYKQAPTLSQEDFFELLAQQCSSYLRQPMGFSFKEFSEKLTSGKTHIDFAPNALSSKATREDIVAIYKLFLGRFPENEEVITPRIGLEMPLLLKSFLLSDEFIERQENWPMLLQAEEKIKSKTQQK